MELQNIWSKVQEQFKKFLEWNKSGWNAGGKERWKVIGVWVVILLVFGGGNDKNKTNTTASSVERVVLDNISFQQIRYKMNTMTEMQFDEYAESLKGKVVQWRGYVENVDSKMFGGYEVQVDMDSPSQPISVQDVTFDVSKEQAISLTKDRPIRFQGTISLVQNIFTSLQISLDDAVVIQ